MQYNAVKRSSYIKLPSELINCAKGSINIKTKDNECFRWCHMLNRKIRILKKFEKTTSIIYINKFFYLYYISVCVCCFPFFSFLISILYVNVRNYSIKRIIIKKYINIYINKLDYSNIEFPVSVKQYNKIEKQNNIKFYVVYKLRL